MTDERPVPSVRRVLPAVPEAVRGRDERDASRERKGETGEPPDLRGSRPVTEVVRVSLQPVRGHPRYPAEVPNRLREVAAEPPLRLRVVQRDRADGHLRRLPVRHPEYLTPLVPERLRRLRLAGVDDVEVCRPVLLGLHETDVRRDGAGPGAGTVRQRPRPPAVEGLLRLLEPLDGVERGPYRLPWTGQDDVGDDRVAPFSGGGTEATEGLPEPPCRPPRLRRVREPRADADLTSVRAGPDADRPALARSVSLRPVVEPRLVRQVAEEQGALLVGRERRRLRLRLRLRRVPRVRRPSQEARRTLPREGVL